MKCLVRDTSDVKMLKELGAELYHGDLGDSESLERLPEGGDVVFHLAALVSDWGERREFRRFNVDATMTLLEASLKSGVKRFVHMSSSTVVWKSDFWNVHNLIRHRRDLPVQGQIQRLLQRVQGGCGKARIKILQGPWSRDRGHQALKRLGRRGYGDSSSGGDGSPEGDTFPRWAAA